MILKTAIKETSKKLNIPEDVVTATYMSYWKWIRHHMESQNLKDVSEEDFNSSKHNINIGNLGKFFTTWSIVNTVNKRYHDTKESNPNV